jgi:hypothetical protein
MPTATIDINLDKKCRRCGEKGTVPNGLCLKCVIELIKAGAFDHIIRRPAESDDDANNQHEADSTASDA